MKKKLGIFGLLLAVVLNGCGMMFLGSSDYVDVKTRPAGATVLIDGVDMGKTPIELELETNKSYIVILRKDGYICNVLTRCNIMNTNFLRRIN